MYIIVMDDNLDSIRNILSGTFIDILPRYQWEWRTAWPDPDRDVILFTKKGNRLLPPGQVLILNNDGTYWKDADYLEPYIK